MKEQMCVFRTTSFLMNSVQNQIMPGNATIFISGSASFPYFPGIQPAQSVSLTVFLLCSEIELSPMNIDPPVSMGMIAWRRQDERDCIIIIEKLSFFPPYSWKPPS